jgi:hypothetical protein
VPATPVDSLQAGVATTVQDALAIGSLTVVGHASAHRFEGVPGPYVRNLGPIRTLNTIEFGRIIDQQLPCFSD